MSKHQDIPNSFTDADFAGDIDSQKFTSGWLFSHNGSAVSWASKKQSLVTHSSFESELVAGSLASAEGIWFIQLGTEFWLHFHPI